MAVTTDPVSAQICGTVRDALVGRIESGALRLPVLRDSAARVLSLTSDSDCDIAQIAAVVQRDASLTGHVLRIANSALYAPPAPIVSLAQAVSRLGTGKVRDITMAVSCRTDVFKVEGFDGVVIAMFRHSIAAATFAQEIARLRRWNVEEAFLCGLFSDIGRPVALQALVDLTRELRTEVPAADLVAGAAEFHCRIGSELIKSWKLPARLAETILFHHEPEKAPSASQTAMLARLASDFAHWLTGPRKVTEDELGAHPLCVPLNLYPDEMAKLIAFRDRAMAAVEAVG